MIFSKMNATNSTLPTNNDPHLTREAIQEAMPMFSIGKN